MMGATHRLGGVTSALGAYVLANSSGVVDAESVALYSGLGLGVVSMVVIYPFAVYGSTASDLDHHPGSSPHKDIVSVAVNRLLHVGSFIQGSAPKRSLRYKLGGILNAKHRSWQTHSDFTVLLLSWVLWAVATGRFTVGNGVETVIVQLAIIGLICGLLAHLFLDAITPEGIHLLTGKAVNKVLRRKVVPEVLRLVPRKPVRVPVRKKTKAGYRRVVDESFFATGHTWEVWVARSLRFINTMLFVWIVYDLQPYKLVL